MQPATTASVAENRWFKQDLFREGLWRARVVRNNDLEKRGRLQVRIWQLYPPPHVGEDGLPRPGISDDALPWAEPAFPWGGKTNSATGAGEGFFALPSVGSDVWVAFEQGYVGRPIWLGSWLGQGDLPKEITDPDKVRIMKTPGDLLLLFHDQDQYILLATPNSTSRPQFIKLDKANNTLTIQNDADTKIVLEANKITATQGATTITLEGNKISANVTGNVEVVASGTAAVNAAGTVSLGVGAAKGVALDSLLTVLNAIVLVFNAHTHNYTDDGAPMVTAVPNSAAVPGIPGVDTSTTVRARA